MTGAAAVQLSPLVLVQPHHHRSAGSGKGQGIASLDTATLALGRAGASARNALIEAYRDVAASDLAVGDMLQLARLGGIAAGLEAAHRHLADLLVEPSHAGEHCGQVAAAAARFIRAEQEVAATATAAWLRYYAAVQERRAAHRDLAIAVRLVQPERRP